MGRRVYFCFNETVHLVLLRLVAAARLLEAGATVDVVSERQFETRGRGINNHSDGVVTVDTCAENAKLHRSPLDGVVVVGLPFGDDVANPMNGVEPFSPGAFMQTYEKYEKVLNVPKSAMCLEKKQFYDYNRKVKGEIARS